MYGKLLVVSAVALAALVVAVSTQSTAPTTLSQENRCNLHNGSGCATCLGNSSTDLRCYWCEKTQVCSAFTVTTAIPIRGLSCPANRYNVGTCLLDVLIIIILIAVVCVIFIVVICCCCCCCCIACANRNKRMKILEENHYLDEKDNIRQRSADRRQERQAKHDDIRRKYGLNTEQGGDGNYKRLN